MPLVAAGRSLVALIALGKVAHDRLRQNERYTLAFSRHRLLRTRPGWDTPSSWPRCSTSAACPTASPRLDDDTPARLADAFGRHPWVEKVEEVRMLPPDRAQVRLVFRTPVLAVPQENQVRVVDRHGILLPHATPADGLLVLRRQRGRPTDPAGSAWGDETVHAAAAVAGYLRASQDQLGLTECEVRDGVVELRGGGARVVWGSPPDSWSVGEAPAEAKLRRLLDYCAVHGRLDAGDTPIHDVRAP